MKRIRRFWGASVGVAILLVFSACGSYGEVVSETRTVESEGAESVVATFDMSSGRLSITGGASAMMTAELTYSEKLEPEITYRVANGQGQLEMNQPGSGFGINWGSRRNDWDIQLTDDLPFEIKIDISSGDSSLNLDTLEITRLEIDSSSGKVETHLAGDQPSLGAVDIDSSSGDIGLDLSGSYEQLSELKLETSSGNIEVNLSGDFSSNVAGEIDASSGDVTVHVPTNVGVRISADTSSGDIRADGFKIDGDNYVNDAYGTAAITVSLDIEVSSGDVTLTLAEE